MNAETARLVEKILGEVVGATGRNEDAIQVARRLVNEHKRKPEWRIGKTFTDRVTGFVGVVTAYSVYDNGCVKFYTERACSPDKDLSGYWFDEHRLLEPKEQSGKPGGGPNPPAHA